MSNVKYRSGDWTVAKPIGILRDESPLQPELKDVLVFHQDYVQLLAYWQKLDYNSINPELAGDPAYLFNESEREDYGGLCVRWTRSWVRIPQSYGKAGGTCPYAFPGFDAATDFGSREPGQKKLVALEILRDFFLCGNFGAFASWQDIPVIPQFQPYDIDTADLTDISAFVDTLRDASGSDPGTSPSLSEYKAMIANGGIIDVQDSKVTNFRGGVYMRERFTVKAQ